MNEANIKRYTNKSNARRGLKTMYGQEVRDMHATLLHEDNTGVYFVFAECEKAVKALKAPKASAATLEAPVTKTQPVSDAQWEKDIREEISLLPAPTAEAPKAARSKAEVRNNIKKPMRGKCADVWAALDAFVTENGKAPVIADVKALNEAKGWNVNNTTIEFYNWRKFNA